jgi:FKBP-type peptidyl-prolyl cis-trans isomerase
MPRRTIRLTATLMTTRALAALLAVASLAVLAPSTPALAQTVPSCQLLTTASGLQYCDLTVGTGATAVAGQTVTVNYTGWLDSGKKFDSSLDRHEPFSFHLGKHEVIKGWEEGVAGMKVGGKRRLRIPPALAYGANGHPPVIPAAATLVFEVEVLGVK